MNAIARRTPSDMLSKTITVTTEPGLVSATAKPRTATTGMSVSTYNRLSAGCRTKLLLLTREPGNAAP
jgi:hypothetical protein